jgi:two-component system, sensor histidine kinase YesM
MSGQPVKRGRQTTSLRRTLVIYLMTGSLLPLLLVGVLTYSSVYSVLSNKIKSGISASLKQEAANLENAINNLDFASKQFALDGQIVNEVAGFIQEQQVFNKSQMMTSIQEKINLVNFTNPYLGLTAYIEPDAPEPVLFTNLQIAEKFDSTVLPRFIQYNGADYYGPHPTKYSTRSNLVISEMRAVRIQSERPLFIYLETSYSLFRSILNEQSYGMKVAHVLVNESGDITYTEDEGLPPAVRDAIVLGSGDYESVGSYHLFRYKSQQGWQLITAVSNSTFNSEIYAWFKTMLAVALATLIFAGILAWLIWKQIYRPLHKVNVEIVRTVENRTSPVSYTNVDEFDFVLRNFQEMKDQINGLITAVENNEKEKGRFEIEKLLSQINPHFLHNTLNTVQWLARMNGQKDIDKLVTLLIKVLHYNLGKQSLIVSIADEIEALRNYMELQRIRYDYEFEFQLHTDEDTLPVAVPRFLLQPLVENAIYHGAGDRKGQVDITIQMSGPSHVLLCVEDNGAGMDEEAARRLLTDDEAGRKRGLGIGLSYVYRMLKQFYGDRMTLSIKSEPGVGTSVTILIPKLGREDFE